MFEALGALKTTALEYLEFNAGKDSIEDRYYVGLIAGLNSVLHISLADIQEEESNDS